MTSQDRASRWFRRNLSFRYGIETDIYLTHDGICGVFLLLAGQCLLIRGYSWSHVISRVKRLLPEILIRPPFTAIDRANTWLERLLTETHGIPIYLGNDEAGLPWAMIPLEDERYVVRAYCWTHLIAQVKQLLPELNIERSPWQDEPPETCC